MEGSSPLAVSLPPPRAGEGVFAFFSASGPTNRLQIPLIPPHRGLFESGGSLIFSRGRATVLFHPSIARLPVALGWLAASAPCPFHDRKPPLGTLNHLCIPLAASASLTNPCSEKRRINVHYNNYYTQEGTLRGLEEVVQTVWRWSYHWLLLILWLGLH